MPFMIIWSLDLHPTPSQDSLWTFVYLLSSNFDTPSITELTTVATPVIAVPTIIIIWMNFFMSISDHIKLNTRLLITRHDWLGLPSNSLIFTYTSQCKDTRFVAFMLKEGRQPSPNPITDYSYSSYEIGLYLHLPHGRDQYFECHSWSSDHLTCILLLLRIVSEPLFTYYHLILILRR